MTVTAPPTNASTAPEPSTLLGKIRLEDFFTIPNAISALGFALTAHGSARADTGPGITETVVGRLLDLVDGKVARALNQSSEVGAGIDATFDKAGVLAIGINEWRKGIAPKPALVAIAVQNAVNLLATAVSTRLSTEDDLVPTTDGKAAMAYQNGALGAYSVSALFRTRAPVVSRVFRIIGDIDTIVGTGYFGVKASSQYMRQMVRLIGARRH